MQTKLCFLVPWFHSFQTVEVSSNWSSTSGKCTNSGNNAFSYWPKRRCIYMHGQGTKFNGPSTLKRHDRQRHEMSEGSTGFKTSLKKQVLKHQTRVKLSQESHWLQIAKNSGEMKPDWHLFAWGPPSWLSLAGLLIWKSAKICETFRKSKIPPLPLFSLDVAWPGIHSVLVQIFWESPTLKEN